MVMGELTQETEVLVIGSGPGGYAAAFRAADLGLDVTMVDPGARPGGVCLYKGCIPSKTFLYLAELIHDAARAEDMGVSFGKPRIDLAALRTWKGRVIDQMADGLVSLNNRRGVQLLKGRVAFESSETVRVHDTEVSHIKFRHAILATGSRPIPFPGTAFKPGGRIMSSTGALALADVPEKLLILGGGYVGLELGTVYAALGSRVSLVELEDQLLTGVDRDLVEPLHRKLNKLFDSIHLKTKVVSISEKENGVDVTLEGNTDSPQQTYDRVLVAIGRAPVTGDVGLDNTRVELDERGFVIVDDRQRTGDDADVPVIVPGGCRLQQTVRGTLAQQPAPGSVLREALRHAAALHRRTQQDDPSPRQTRLPQGLQDHQPAQAVADKMHRRPLQGAGKACQGSGIAAHVAPARRVAENNGIKTTPAQPVGEQPQLATRHQDAMNQYDDFLQRACC